MRGGFLFLPRRFAGQCLDTHSTAWYDVPMPKQYLTEREPGMNIEDWRSQLRRGTLEYCILLMLHRRPCYGYEILQRLGRCAVTTATESTVYPLLRRLQKDGCLTANWQDTAEGLPPRKYYALTPAGEEYLQAMRADWASLLDAVARLNKEE